MKYLNRLAVLSLCLAGCVVAQQAAAITLQVDYSYDTSNFFGAGNPQGAAAGAQAKTTLESAASYFSSILTDSFSAIQTPAHFSSTAFDGVVDWSWSETFDSPATGASVEVVNPTVPANKYIIYAGAQNLTANTAGIGSAGGFSYLPYTSTGMFSQSEINQINSTTNSFISAITTRGQSSGFVNWGGVVSFDNTARNWHFNSATLPTASETDFYSIAIHELAHALGFGEQSDPGPSAWQTLVSGSNFTGINSETLNGFQPVPLSADLAHWAQGTTSVVYGTSIAQETSMSPSITDGTRKTFTALDAAGLKDIGWSLILPPGVNGDYNNNGVVDAADYVIWRAHLGQSFTLPNDTTPGTVTQSDYNVWRSNFGASAGSGSGSLVGSSAVPEPASVALLVLGWAALVPCRSRRGISRRAC